MAATLTTHLLPCCSESSYPKGGGLGHTHILGERGGDGAGIGVHQSGPMVLACDLRRTGYFGIH